MSTITSDEDDGTDKIEPIIEPIIEETNDCIRITYDSGDFLHDKATAAFDLDYTIIKTKSGKVFPRDKDDWLYLYDNTVSFLRDLSNTHNIVIFTNQSGFKKTVKKEVFMEKIINIIKDLSIPIRIYISVQSGYFRKPLTGMWGLYKSQSQSTTSSSSVSQSTVNSDDFYCGDACGRKGDFSNTDYLFSHNIGINFYTPEQMFLKKKEHLEPLYPKYLADNIGEIDDIVLPTTSKIMILMCGYPGCGKSSISRTFGIPLSGIDIQGTKSKSKKFILEQLKNSLNVVVDNTNHTKTNRNEYIELGKKYDYHCVIIYIDNDIEYCYYMNQLRCELSKGETKLVPKIAYHTLKKRFEIPDESECDTLIQLNFLKRSLNRDKVSAKTFIGETF
jgi:bifunctional polynucleotide phosphatase/kinase